MHTYTRRFASALVLCQSLGLMVMGARPASAAGGGIVFYKATLTGTPSGSPHGRGTAVIELSLNTVCAQFTASRIRLPATGAHLIGPGPAGKVSVALTPPGRNGTSQGCTSISRPLLAFLVAHYHSYAVQVETVTFPAGAIRGRLYKPRVP